MEGHALATPNAELMADCAVDVSPLGSEAEHLAERARRPMYAAIDGAGGVDRGDCGVE